MPKKLPLNQKNCDKNHYRHNHGKEQKWQFWIDRGGTFTDIIARHPNGTVMTHKLLSENPLRYSDAAIQGIRDLLGVQAGTPLPTEKISAIKMGTTVATNALLEKKGERTLLVTTQGLKDQLRIGYQDRPDLFALDIQLPKMLYCEVLEVEERIDARGNILTPLNEAKARAGLQAAYERGVRSMAIVLMHGHCHPRHEKILETIARDTGFQQISVSHQVCPLMGFIPRGGTTIVDAYLSPVLGRYTNQITKELDGLQTSGGKLMFMGSNGGLTEASFFRGKDGILSGPAGGVVGMARVSEAAGMAKIIGFDMGGTSTDVSHYNGEFEKTLETHIAGVRLFVPMMMIHTVAAGGGSILHFDKGRYQVGPDSAGALPGPASYGNGGPLTITDCNVMLGKLRPEFFPSIFGKNGNLPLDAELVQAKFNQLAEQIARECGDQRSPEAVAFGFLTIAVENMANAIKKISVQRGYDISQYTLCCFGGAGGQHACLVADALGMNQVLLHPFAGVLSAYGMGLADTIVNKQQGVESIFNKQLLPQLEKTIGQLQTQGARELEERGEAPLSLQFNCLLHIRYQGSDTALAVPFAKNSESIKAQFEDLHRMRFGLTSPEKNLIIKSIQVEVISPATAPQTIDSSTEKWCGNGNGNSNSNGHPQQIHPCFMDHRWTPTPFYHRESLDVNTPLIGPAIILDSTGTVVVEPGWKAILKDDGNLLLKRHTPRQQASAVGTQADPVMLEIFNNLFMSIAEQMGAVLKNTAASVNIRERMDFSCALFDGKGALVANAPHIPVHLGSMGESVKVIIQKRGANLQPGDAYVLNAPYCGGTHLPDITVVKPVFVHNRPVFYVASRGHHADIGGTAPGSAPANSTHIEEEGVILDNIKLVENGRFLEDQIYRILTSPPWPARNPAINIADLKAQLMACEKGAQELLKIAGHYGPDILLAYMKHIQDNAEESVRKVLEKLGGGEFTYRMDDGHQIAVSIKVDRANRKGIIDFTGSSPQHPGNFNAPTAVVKAAVLYVFRCLVGENIPLNEGQLKPLEIIIPKNSIINPSYPAAVVAGNVETSQAIVDTLLAALEAAAGSQGTMNNFIWGNEHYQYYETICGGAGATKQGPGASAVQTHMTNSRLTDPEVLEWNFPAILESFQIRIGSGGKGKNPGGDGVTRRIKFLESVTANIISGHRQVPPYGLHGGGTGQVGHNWVEYANGQTVHLPGTAQLELTPGDVIVIQTPGGGAWGELSSS